MSNVTVINNDSYVEITGMLKNQTWETIDLAPFLTHDDPKAVIVHIVNTNATANRVGGAKPVGSSVSDNRVRKKIFWPNGCSQIPVALGGIGGTQVQLFAVNSDVDFFILAEFGGDNFVAYSDAIVNTTGLGNQWVTKDSTGNFGADAGNVSAVLLWITWNNAGDWGYRKFGSTDDWHPNNAAGSQTFGICGIDAEDRYQFYPSKSGGKSPVFQSWFYEVGYIKKDPPWYAVTNPVDRDLNTTGAWTDEDISDIVNEGVDAAAIALVRLHNGEPTDTDGWIRNDNGSQPVPTLPTFKATEGRHALVNLTAEEVYEYWIEYALLDQYILGWFVDANVLGLDSKAIGIDGGAITIG